MRVLLIVALLCLLSSVPLASSTKREGTIRGSAPTQPPTASPVYLWPLPSNVSSGSGSRVLSYPLTFSTFPTFPDLTNAIARFTSTAFPHRATGATGNDSILGVEVMVRDISAPLQQGVDESYTLIVRESNYPEAAGISISAGTYWGALHGLETLSQLIYFNFSTSTYSIPSTPWRIIDVPRYTHRGMLVDTSRHFQDLPIIRRTIDSLTYAKLNVFHWHLSDTQSFPWGPEVLPRFSMGAWSPAERYSSADIEDIVEYARQRGVRVMIEFDIPGHAGSWCVGYPEVCPSPTCKEPLDPSSNATYALLQSLFTEVSGGRNRAGLFPEDLIHLGGDEVDLSCWTEVPRVANWLKANNYTAKDAYRYIVERAHDMVYAAGRIPVNWDEVYVNFGKTIDPQTIIHVWRDIKTVAAAAADGFRVLVSPDGPWYLDALGETWQTMYALNPSQGITDPTQLSLVLGGEVTMWGETVDASVILATIWPRAAAVAERLWSPAGTTDATAAEPRYAWFRCLLDQRGIEAGPYKNANARSSPPGPGGCLAQ